MSTEHTEIPARLTVGYLATDSGADGVALAVALARVTGASIDLVCVVRPPQFDGSPGLAQFQERLEEQAARWLEEAAATVPDDIGTTTRVVVDDSFADGLIAVAQESSAAMIVVGGTGDGLISRHVLGTVSTALLHSSPLPVALAPRGYADREAVAIDMVTAAVPVRVTADNPLGFAESLAITGKLDIRLLSLVSIEAPFDDDSTAAARAAQVAVAKQLLDDTRTAIAGKDTRGKDLEVEAVVADGATLDEALDNLQWDDNDIVAVGSGHLASPHRVFLGSTASRILRWTTAPVIVIPRTR